MNTKNNIHSLTNNSKAKDKQLLLNHIRKAVEKKTGLSFKTFVKICSQRVRYRVGLECFTTTNKTICKALIIPTEAGTRRKRELEKQGLLVSTPKKQICPYKGSKAHYYTTNPALFDAVINYKIDE
jgi:hypothetical protein